MATSLLFLITFYLATFVLPKTTAVDRGDHSKSDVAQRPMCAGLAHSSAVKGIALPIVATNLSVTPELELSGLPLLNVHLMSAVVNLDFVSLAE